MATYQPPLGSNEGAVITDDAAEIVNLLRHGWTEQPAKPSYNTATEVCVWIGDEWAVRSLTPQEIACAQGEVIWLAMLADFATYPLGLQLHFAQYRDPLKQMLQAGQIAVAKDALQTAPTFGDPDIEALRDKLIAHFP